MTPEELEVLILESKSGKNLRDAFATLSDSERKALSTTASKIKAQLFRGTPNKDASDRLIKHLEKGDTNAWNKDSYRNITLAAFALCPISVLKKNDLFISAEHEEAFQQIIIDRKPEWLDDWIAFDLESEFPRIRFSILRNWIKEGVCHKPSVDGYYRMLAWNLMAIEYRKDRPAKLPLSQQLLNDPDMLNDVWRLFEIENQAFNTDGWRTANAPINYESWPDALVKLSDQGLLNRSRLLEASVKGLHLDIKQNQLSGFHKFHEKLKPTKEERLSLQPEYLSLLCHSIGHVVKFSLAMLGELEKDKNLDWKMFLSEVQSVFFNEAKSNAVTALKIIKRVFKNAPTLQGLALSTTLEALRHPSIDVQNMAYDLLNEHQEKLSDEIKHEISSLSNHVAESLKARLALLTNSPLETTTNQNTSAAYSDIHYHSLSPNILDHLILPHIEPVQPIMDTDELISAISHAVEVVDSPDEVERILDAISRLCGKKSDDFKKKVAPLLHRLNEGGGLATTKGIAGGYGGVKLALADLLLTWLTNRRYHSPNNTYFSESGQFEPTILHIRNIIKRVADNKPKPLISAPTHTGGWIDPLVWIERLVEAEAQHVTFDRLDFCFSLLRLSPDNRQQALKLASVLPNDIRRVVVFALGGDEKLNHSDRKNYELWISAARCRDPYADWGDFFEPLKLNDVWPDSLHPATYEWKAYLEERKQEYNYGGKKTVEVFKTPKFDVEVTIAGHKNAGVTSDGVLNKIKNALSTRLATDWKHIPSAALNHHVAQKYSWSGDLNTSWVSQWLTYRWPLYPSGAYIAGAKQQVSRIDMDGSNWTPTFGFFYGLFQKNRPWCEAAHLLLGLGLIAKDADSRGLAIDALICGIDNGSLEIKKFSDILIRISNGGWLKLNRLGDNLLQVSHVSTRHACVIYEIIQNWLQATDISQHNFFRMLEVLLECQSLTNQSLMPESCDVLKKINGSGKSAKLAKQLLTK